MAYSISDKVPATFVIIKIGIGEKDDDENSITIVNRIDGKNENLSNVHLIGLNVDQISFDTIKYTIELQYHPNTFERGNPNKLEQAISNILVNSSSSEDKSRNITIQFGYSSGSPYPRNIRTTSDIYVGSILEMKTNLNQNYISYTITAFGKYIDGSNSRLDDSVSLSIKDPITTWIHGLWGVSSIQGKYYLPDLFRKHFRFSSDVTLPSLWELSGWSNLYSKVDTEVTKTNNSNSIMFTNDNNSNSYNPMSASNAAVTKVHDDATINFLESCLLEFSTNDVSVNAEQKSLQFAANFDFITLLNGIINKVNLLCLSDNIKRNPNAAKFYKHQFAIVLDSYLGSNEQYGIIRLVDINETKNRPKFNYTFNYGSIESGDTFDEHLVLSWDCDFNATAAIHSTELTEEIGVTRFIGPTGEMSLDFGSGLVNVFNVATSLLSEDSKQTSADNIAKLKQTWNYPYNATLTVLGNPTPIKICQHLIYVNPMINNRKHHTAGNYLVTGVSHSFDASMHYTTTYKLTRLDDDTAKKFTEVNADFDKLNEELVSISEQKRTEIYGYKNITY